MTLLQNDPGLTVFTCRKTIYCFFCLRPGVINHAYSAAFEGFCLTSPNNITAMLEIDTLGINYLLRFQPESWPVCVAL